MPTKNVMDFRCRVYQRCLEVLEERIHHSEIALNQARDAIREDTKSSAGDKYETTRERLQQDVQMQEVQLTESRKLRYVLQQFEPARAAQVIQPGSLVKTKDTWIFLAVSLGWVELEGERVMVLSPAAPMGRALLGKPAGAQFSINGKQHLVESFA